MVLPTCERPASLRQQGAHVHRRTLLARRGEQRAPHQAGQADEQHVRELLHPHVVQVHRGVVVLAAVCDLLLEPADAPLQLEVRGARLQVRIGLGGGEQPADAARQLLLGGQPRASGPPLPVRARSAVTFSSTSRS